MRSLVVKALLLFAEFILLSVALCLAGEILNWIWNSRARWRQSSILLPSLYSLPTPARLLALRPQGKGN